MKVYILKFHMRGGGFRFGSYSRDDTLGVYATEDAVKQELKILKEKFLSNGPGYLIMDHTTGRGFTGYHEAGSMSFTPGAWFYEEQEVKD